MLKIAESFFENEKIEYFAALRYSDCKEIRPDILKRCDAVAKSVIIFLLPYYSGCGRNISAYAVAKDYHAALKCINERLIARLKADYPENSFFGFGDHSPIDERHAAAIAGLGIIGDNRLLINERYGSFVFIGEIITDTEPEILGAKAPCALNRCHGCGICKI